MASAFAQVLSEAAKSKSIAKSSELIAEEIHGSYPFHPSVKHVIALFKENESYRQTRGLMQFISKMIKSAWDRPTNDVHLIGCQHLNLNIGDVREEINKISNLQGAIAHDIAAGGKAAAEVADANLHSDAASQVASLVLTASLSESIDAVKGFTKPQMLECLIAPNRAANEFLEAFEALRGGAWYLHRKENEAYYFSNIENLQKRIDNRADAAPQPKVDAEMKRRLEEIFRPLNKNAYQDVHALPKIDEIKLNGPTRVCLILSPDSKTPPQEAQRFLEGVTEKNNFCVLTGDGSSLGNLEDKTRRIWAIVRVLEETGGEKSPHKTELEDEDVQAVIEFNSTVVNLFNRVYYPTKSGLTPAKLSMTFTGNQFLAEDQIEKALSDVGASKLVMNVEANAEMLMTRAEDMLWSGKERRVPWRDVASRAMTNPRWLWLPPKGLEHLRKIAEGQGRWRYTEDGYIEKGPFPPPRTSVSVAERVYDERTGQATIEVQARDAGPNGRVHYSTNPDVSKESPVIPDTIFPTDETVLWFLAVDPDGARQTGDPVRWSNHLNLTHERKTMPGGKRIVELTVRPRGDIRWNTTGANAKEGNVYTGPIELTDTAEVTVYAYAEDQGIGTHRNFIIPKPDQTGATIDKAKAAKLHKKLDFHDNAKSFAALNSAKGVQADLCWVSVEIGDGAKNVTTRFGSETVISAERLETFIAAARQAIGDDTAEVKLSFRDSRFQSGHDLETFLAKLGIDVGAGEVEQ